MAFEYSSTALGGFRNEGAAHAKRFQFHSVSQRAAAQDVAIGRQVKDSHELGAAPKAGGEHACFFSGELTTLLDIDGSRDYGDFAREVYPLSRTMPLLLLHKRKIVDAFMRHLRKERTMAWKSLLHLLTVLGRDLRQELYEDFRSIFLVLMDILNPSIPELTAEVFKTLAYLFKYLSQPLLADVEGLKELYGPVLAHPREYIRDFGAQSFAYLLRRLESKAMVKHACGLLRSMGTATDEAGAGHAAVTLPDAAQPWQRGAFPDQPGDRPHDLKQGMSALLLQLLQGVQQGLHSRAPDLLAAALKTCRPKAAASPLPASTSQAADAVQVSQASDAKLVRRMQVLQMTLTSLQRGLSNDAAGTVLKVLHGEVRAAMGAWAAAAGVPPPSKRPRSTDAVGEGHAAPEPARSTQDAALAASLSLHIARVLACLTRWHAASCWRFTLDTGEPGRLMSTLRRVLDPAVLGHRLCSGFVRAAGLMLLINVWKVCLARGIGKRRRQGKVAAMLARRAAEAAAAEEEEVVEEGGGGAPGHASEEEEEEEEGGEGGSLTDDGALAERLEGLTALVRGVFIATASTEGVDGVQPHPQSLGHTTTQCVPTAAEATALGAAMLNAARWVQCQHSEGVSGGQGEGAAGPLALITSGTAAPPASTTGAAPAPLALTALQLAFCRDALVMAVGDCEGRAGRAALRAVPARAELIASLIPGCMAILQPMASATTAATAPSAVLLCAAPLVSSLHAMWDALNGATEVTARALPEVDAATGAARTALDDLAPALGKCVGPTGRLMLLASAPGQPGADAQDTAAKPRRKGKAATPAKRAKEQPRAWHAAVLASQRARQSRKRPREATASAPATSAGKAPSTEDVQGVSGTQVALAIVGAVQALLPTGTLSQLAEASVALEALCALHLEGEAVLPAVVALARALLRKAKAGGDWMPALGGSGTTRAMLSDEGVVGQRLTAAALALAASVTLSTCGAPASADTALMAFGTPPEPKTSPPPGVQALGDADISLALQWAGDVATHQALWYSAWRLSDTPDVAGPGAEEAGSHFTAAFMRQRLLAGGLGVAALRSAFLFAKAANAAAALTHDVVPVLAADGTMRRLHGALGRDALRQVLGRWALVALASPERSTRLLTLQLLCQFHSAPFTPRSAAKAASTGAADAGGDGASDSEASSSSDSDEGDADEGTVLAAFSGPCNVLLKAFQLELMPKTLLTERPLTLGLQRWGRMLAAGVLEDAEGAVVVGAALGALHARFKPLYTAAQALLGLALHHVKPLAWPLLARAVLHATCARPSVDLSHAALLHVLLDGTDGAVLAAPQTLAVQAEESGTDAAALVAGRLVSALAGSAGLRESPQQTRLHTRFVLGAVYGTVGAASLMPSVANQVGDLNAAREGRWTSGRLLMASVAREQVLALGAAGHVDAGTLHAGLTQLLGQAQRFLRKHALPLVALALGSTMRDYYAGAGRNDPDAIELRLPSVLRRLAADAPAGALPARHGGIVDSSPLPQAASGAVVLSAILDVPPEQGAQVDPRAADGAPTLPMPARDTTHRLANFVRMFAKVHSWAHVPAADTLQQLAVRLLSKPQGGLAKAGLSLLLAFGPSHIVPYKASLTALVTEASFRTELTRFSLAPGAGGIGTEHRRALIPTLIRILFGRIMQRQGGGGRTAQYARRAAILSYLAGLAPRELSAMVYLTLRSFTVLMPEDADVADMPADFGFAPTNAVDAALAQAYAQEFLPGSKHIPFAPQVPKDAAQAQACVDLFGAVAGAVPAPRAIGFLHMAQHILKQMGRAVHGHLHLLLAPIAALYQHATAVLAAQAADAEEDRASASGSEASDDEEEEDHATLLARKRSEGVDARAQEVRGLCLQRLTDAVRAFPEHPILPHFLAALGPTFAPAVTDLPLHACKGKRSPYMLRLLHALSSHPATAPLLLSPVIFPGAVPAVLQTLTAGMGVWGPSVAQGTHGAGDFTHPGLPSQGRVTVASVITGTSPAPAILDPAFSIAEALMRLAFGPPAGTEAVDMGAAVAALGQAGEGTTALAPLVQQETGMDPATAAQYRIPSGPASLRAHLPLLLHALTVRIAARGRAESIMTSLQEGDVAGVAPVNVDGVDEATMMGVGARRQAVAAQRNAAKAFARRELALVMHAADSVVQGGGQAAAGDMTLRLFALLLPQVAPSQRDVARLRRAGGVSQGGADELGAAGGSAAGGVAARDARAALLDVLLRLAPSIPPAAAKVHLPLLTGLLAPGPFAVLGDTRRKVVRLIGALPGIEAQAPLQTLQQLNARSSKRVGLPDFDTILAALRTLEPGEGGEEEGGSGNHMAAILGTPGPETVLAPALLQQVAACLHDDDVAVSTTAGTVLDGIICHLARRIGSWAADHTHSPLCLPVVPFFTLCARADEGRGHDARGWSAAGALALLVEVVAPSLRTSLASASSTVRRTVVRLLRTLAVEAAEWPPGMMGDVTWLVGPSTATWAHDCEAATDTALPACTPLVELVRGWACEAAPAAAAVGVSAESAQGEAAAWMTTPLCAGPLLPTDCPILHLRPEVLGRPGGAAVPAVDLGRLFHADAAVLCAISTGRSGQASQGGAGDGAGGAGAAAEPEEEDADDGDEEGDVVLGGASASGQDGHPHTPATRDALAGLAHIKLHRRARAFKRVAAVITAPDCALAPATVQHIILPLALQALFDHPVAPGKRKGKTLTAHFHELQRAGAALIGAAASALAWPAYTDLLRRLARLIGEQDADGALQRALMDALAQAVEALPWEVAEELPPDTQVVIAGAMTAGAARRLQAAGRKAASRVPGLAALRRAVDGEGESSDDSDVEEEEQEGGEGEAAGASAGESEEATPAQPVAPLTWAQRLRGVLLSWRGSTAFTPDAGDVARHLYVRVLPKLKELLQPLAKRATGLDAHVTAAGAGGTDPRRAMALARLRRSAPRTAQLRTPIALALVKLLKALPQSVFIVELPSVLARMTGVLTSKTQEVRDRTRAALVAVSKELGAQYMPYTLRALHSTLKEGYQVHVLGHTVHAILAGLVEGGELDPPTPGSHDADGDGEGDEQLSPASDALVSSLPLLLDMVMNDVMGAVALARQVDSGFKPKIALAEAKSCRSYETYGLLARVVPFLPHPAVHALLAPPMLALKAQGTVARVRRAVDELLSQGVAGLLANVAVRASPPGLLMLVFCLVRDNLMTPGVATEAALAAAHHAGRDVREGWRAKEAAMAAAASVGQAAASGDRQALLAAARASVALRREKAARARRRTLGQAAAWTVHDPYTAVEASMGAVLGNAGMVATGSGDGAVGALMSAGAISSAAARLAAVFEEEGDGGGGEGGSAPAAQQASTGAPTPRSASAAALGITAFPTDTHKIAPEPRMTGTGRYVWTRDGLSESVGSSGGNALAAGKLVWLGLNLLQASLRKRVVSLAPAGEGGTLPDLDPFVPLLAHTLTSTRQSDLLTLALRGLTLLLPHTAALPSMEPNAKGISKAILRHVRSTAGGGRSAGPVRDALAQCAARATVAMLKHLRGATISEGQLSALLVLVAADLQHPQRAGATLQLLRCIVTRRLMAPELYETMDAVSHFMVQGTRPATRAQCARVFLTYLLHYPLSGKRLAGYMHFFLANLAYSQQAGRLAVLDMLLAIIKQFPPPVLAEHAAPMFVALVQRLGLEPMLQVRAGVGAVLQSLLASVEPGQAGSLLDMAASWAGGEAGGAMRRVGLHTLSLAGASSPELLVGRRLAKAMNRAAEEVASAVRAMRSAEEELAGVYASKLAAGEAKAAAGRETFGHDWWGSGDGGDGSALAPEPEGVQEAKASDAASAAMRHAQHLEEDAAAADDGDGDGSDVEDAAATEGSSLALLGAASGSGQASAPDTARAVPSGVAGGGGELEGDDSDASGDGDVDRWGRVVTPAVAARRAAQAQARKAAAALPWDTAYYACTLLQRLWEAHPRVLSEAAAGAGGSGSGSAPASGTKRRRKAGKAQESDATTTAVTLHSALWTSLDALTDIMVFPHAWVRAAAARWLGAVLNTVAVASVGSCPPPPGVAAWLAGNERLFALARAACVQLADGTLSTEQGTALAPVLLFTAVGLYATTPPSSRNTIPPHLAERTARLAGKSTLLVGGVEVVGGKAVQRDSSPSTHTAHDDDDGGARDPLFWLLQRLSNTAVHKGGPAATTALNVFGAMAGHLPQADLQRYVVPVARAVFRTVQAAEHVASDPRLADAPSWSEQAQQAAAAAEAGALASEVMEAVQAAMGADVFLTAYNGERRARAAAKERRAKQVAQEAVVNPAAAAARRSRKAQAKKRHVAKRMDKLKVLRGGGGKGRKRAREE